MIGIIYFSHTGHTAQVVDRLAERLREAGKAAEAIALEPVGTFSPHDEAVRLQKLPDLAAFDQFILASPVHGGRMAAPVRTFLQEAGSLEGKPVALLLTHFLPRQWGAVQTVAAMEALCREKGAQVLGSADVTWFSLSRKKQINESISRISAMLDK